ncbi:MAG: hypothetical protein ACJA0E_001881 [Bermanella sp.]|jgi:hypothetical protein
MMMKNIGANFHKIKIIVFLLLILPMQVIAATYNVTGLKVGSISQDEDDEESPFEIRAINKQHKCGGKPSNLFKVYSEYSDVSNRRYDMAMNAMIGNYSLSLGTHGCKGNALIVNEIRIHHK